VHHINPDGKHTRQYPFPPTTPEQAGQSWLGDPNRKGLVASDQPVLTLQCCFQAVGAGKG
jgi:hypothetical protein